jgi:predicted metal-dependent hydrolase
MAPTYVLDYVIIHEMSHLKEMNHGAEFWALVKELGGQIRPSKRWLKENGTYLHSFL